MASAAVSPTSSSNKRQRTDGSGTSAAGGGKARRRRVGVVGFGSLGQYLVNAILNDEAVSKRMELAFVWNRSPGKLSTLASDKRLEKLEEFDSMGADLIIEVAHPSIIKQYGAKFAAAADLIIGSPTSMADAAVEAAIRKAADVANGFGVYIPSGALWGAQDIYKMASLGNLKGLTITMKKHPSSLKVLDKVKAANDALLAKLAAGEDPGPTTLYEGPVRDLCPQAPNNVNTMAAAALAGHNLGFDKVQARLVADASLTAHVIDIEVQGPDKGGGRSFRVTTERYNPAAKGAVTGTATYASFLSSLLSAGHLGEGLHMC